MIPKKLLVNEYVVLGRSAHEIAGKLKCSDTKVNYWLGKHQIRKRSISDAVYLKNNPEGDPFTFCKPKTDAGWFLYGLGIGLFWGEGNKVDKYSVRIGNSDPSLIRVFLVFLSTIFSIEKSKLRFGLQVFSDVDPVKAKNYWIKKLKVSEKQFQKVVVTNSGKVGTYRNKNQYGVLTVYFSNVKLRDSIVSAITELQKNSYANVAQSVERIHGKS